VHRGWNQLVRPEEDFTDGWPGDYRPAIRSGRLGATDTQTRRGDPVAEPILQIKKLNKSFGPVHVLQDVDFNVYPGEVSALVGDNGAGKSTLVKCIAGIYTIDNGEILWEGKPVTLNDPRAAAALGIEFVYQDLALADNLDITQNMFLGREIRRFGIMDDGSMEKKAREVLGSLGVRTVSSVRQVVASLSGGQRQTVAIAKAVLWNSKVVFLDEPTAALGVAQTRQVLDLVRRLADQGLGVVLISHNMNDVMEVADRVAALYLGKIAAEVMAKDSNTTQIVELITAGRSGDIGLAAATADQII
jgi:D-xylose transport system ATP-binding protein